MQDVRRAPLRERAPLLDAEPVLLVDDGDGEVAELDLALDQRVRADRDLRLAGRDPAADGAVVAGGQRTRQQLAGDAELEAEVGDGEEVLLGERLRRRHQRALAAVLDRAQERVERDDRLARADVALQQALHRHRPREVGVHLADRLLLVGGQRERERGAVAVDQLARLTEAGGQRPVALGGAAGDPDLKYEQLVEREPLAPALGLVEAGRPVDRGERVAFQRQLLALAQLGRERVVDVAETGERGVDDAADGLRRDLLRGRVDGREVGGGVRLAEVVTADVETVAAELPAQADPRAGPQLVGEPRLVEPGGGDGRAAVVDARGDTDPPPAQRPLGHVQHLACDDDLLALAEIGDPDLVGRGLVAARPVVEDVADAAQAERRELPRGAGPHARDRRHGELEPLGTGRSRGARPLPGLVQACEHRLSTGECHRRRHRAGQSLPPGPDGPAQAPAGAAAGRGAERGTSRR